MRGPVEGRGQRVRGVSYVSNSVQKGIDEVLYHLFPRKAGKGAFENHTGESVMADHPHKSAGGQRSVGDGKSSLAGTPCDVVFDESEKEQGSALMPELRKFMAFQ